MPPHPYNTRRKAEIRPSVEAPLSKDKVTKRVARKRNRVTVPQPSDGTPDEPVPDAPSPVPSGDNDAGNDSEEEGSDAADAGSDQAADNQAVDNQAADNQAADNQAADNQAVDNDYEQADYEQADYVEYDEGNYDEEMEGYEDTDYEDEVVDEELLADPSNDDMESHVEPTIYSSPQPLDPLVWSATHGLVPSSSQYNYHPASPSTPLAPAAIADYQDSVSHQDSVESTHISQSPDMISHALKDNFHSARTPWGSFLASPRRNYVTAADSIFTPPASLGPFWSGSGLNMDSAGDCIRAGVGLEQSYRTSSPSLETAEEEITDITEAMRMQTSAIVPDRFGLLRPIGYQPLETNEDGDGDGGDKMQDQTEAEEGDEGEMANLEGKVGACLLVEQDHHTVSNWGAYRPSEENLAIAREEMEGLSESSWSEQGQEDSRDTGKLFGSDNNTGPE